MHNSYNSAANKHFLLPGLLYFISRSEKHIFEINLLLQILEFYTESSQIKWNSENINAKIIQNIAYSHPPLWE